jgi:hypothetical protein
MLQYVRLSQSLQKLHIKVSYCLVRYLIHQSLEKVIITFADQNSIVEVVQLPIWEEVNVVKVIK